MKVLVTGAAGFLGSWVVPALLERGDEVVACDILTPDQATRLKPVMDKIQYRWMSVVDLTREHLKGVDQVVHLSGVTDVPLANSSPRYTFQLNVDAALSLFLAAQEAKTPVLAMSSENVYGSIPAERLPAVEDEPPRPRNSYAASKVAMETIGHWVAVQYKVPVTVIRSSTLFGPRMRTKQIVSIFSRQALEGKDLTIEGDGSQTRDFNSIENMLGAILRVTELQRPGADLDRGFHVYNIGSGDEMSVLQLVRMIVRLTDSPSKIVHKDWRPGEEGRLCVSIEKARKELGYEPKVSVEEGLSRLIDSLRNEMRPGNFPFGGPQGWDAAGLPKGPSS